MTTAWNKSMEIVKRKLDESAEKRSAFKKPVAESGPTGLKEGVKAPLKQTETLITDDAGIDLVPDLSEYE